jgi:hypothetical protein
MILALSILVCFDLSAAFIFFLVYYVNYGHCSSVKDLQTIEQVVHTLLVTNTIIVFTGFGSFLYHLVKLIQFLLNKEIELFSYKRYRRIELSYQFTMILASLFQTTMGSVFLVFFASLYLCRIQALITGRFCDIDPEFAFSPAGHRLMLYFLVGYILCVPRSIVRLIALIQ